MTYEECQQAVGKRVVYTGSLTPVLQGRHGTLLRMYDRRDCEVAFDGIDTRTQVYAVNLSLERAEDLAWKELV